MNQVIMPDNVDRMFFRVLEETFAAEPWRRERPVLVVNDATGALTQWIQDQGLAVRVLQDSAARAAEQAHLTGPVETTPGPEIFQKVATVVYRLARPLEALEEFSWHTARWAPNDVVLLAGQLQRHLNFSMNTTLSQVFQDVSATRGAAKARALRAQRPVSLTGEMPPRFPRRNTVEIAGTTLQLRAYGLTFGAARLDPGTALLLDTILPTPPAQVGPQATIVDLGCGNGTIAATLAQHWAFDRLIASDDSAAAVASTRATLAASRIDGVEVLHQSGLETLPDESADVVVLNPPFHDGTQLTSDIALYLFDEAERVLVPGGSLLAVFNASRHYRPQLAQRVGQTWQLARDKRFIVTESRKGHDGV